MIKQDEYQKVSFKYFTMEKHKSRVTTSADLVFSWFTFIYVKKTSNELENFLKTSQQCLLSPVSAAALLSLPPLLRPPVLLHAHARLRFIYWSVSVLYPPLVSALVYTFPLLFLLLLCAPVSVHLDLSKMLSYKVGRAERTLRGGRLKNLQRADAAAQD